MILLRQIIGMLSIIASFWSNVAASSEGRPCGFLHSHSRRFWLFMTIVTPGLVGRIEHAGGKGRGCACCDAHHPTLPLGASDAGRAPPLTLRALQVALMGLAQLAVVAEQPAIEAAVAGIGMCPVDTLDEPARRQA